MNIIYETERLLLCPFNRELIQETESRYRKWFYDQEVTKYNSHGLFPYSKKKFEDYLDMCESGEKDIVWGILFKENNEHIGNISLQNINWINRSAEFGIIIGEKEYWGQGIGFEAGSVLLQHGFEKLNLHRIWLGTAMSNEGMNKLALKLGMKPEARFYEAIFLEGKYFDVYNYSILEKEWKVKNDKL